MKKVLIYIAIFVVAFVSAWFLFGYTNKTETINTQIEQSNTLQQNWESNHQKPWVLSNVEVIKYIHEDYSVYCSDKGGSVYGVLMKLKDDYEKYPDSANKKCIDRLISRYESMLKCTNSDELQRYPFIIYDNDYAQLNENIKELVANLNSSFFAKVK